MTSKAHKFRPSPALAISCLALFMALVGTAFAAAPKNSVRSPQIVNGAVKTVAGFRGRAFRPFRLPVALLDAA